MKAYRSFPFYKGTLIDNKGNQGTATGAVFSQMSKGYAIRTSDTETLTYSETPLPSGAFSVVVWAKLEGTNDIASNFMAAISDVVNGNYIALSSPGSKNPAIKMAGSNYRIFNYTVDHQWHCYVFNLPGTANNSISSSSLYVDGVSIAASSTVASGAQASRTGWTNIGGNLSGTGKSFIANLKVYPAVLTEDQVADEQREFERSAIVQYPKRNFQYVKPTDLSKESETHLSKIFGEVDLTTWTAVSATINNASTFTLTGVTGGVKKNLGLIAGNTYKIKITGTRNSTTFAVKSFDGVTTYGSVSGGPFDTTIKFQATDAGIYLYTDGVGSIGVMYSIEVWSYDGLIAAYSFSSKTVIGGYLKDISGNRKHLANTLCTLTKDGMRYVNAKSGPLNIGSIRSVAMRIKLNSINEKILEGAVASNLIYVSSGILTGSTFRNFYVNGVETKIVEAGKWQTIVMTSETYQSFAALTIGLNDTTYGNIEMYDLRFYSQILTVNDAINYHNKFRVPVITENIQDYMVGAKSLLNFYHTGSGEIRENLNGKYWYQSSAGTLETQSDQMNGEWMFSLSSVTANTTKFAFAWDGTNGYEFVIDTNNKVHIYEVTGGVSQEIYLSLNAVSGSEMIDYRIVRLSNIASIEGTSINYPRGSFFIFTRSGNKWVLMETDPSYLLPTGDLHQSATKVRFTLGLGDRLGLFNQFNQVKVRFSAASSDVVAYMLRVQSDLGYIESIDEIVELDQVIRKNSLTPSLAITSGGYKSGKINAYLPTDGTGDMTVTRANATGMRINKRGYWEPVAAGVPRYDFIGGKQLLNIEEARTNLIARYKSFAHSDWAKSGARIEGDPTTAGAELVINGDFSSATGWALSNSTISGGKLIVNSSVSGDVVATRGDLMTVLNKYYIIQINITSYSTGAIRVLLNDVYYTVNTTSASTNTAYLLLQSSASNRLVIITSSESGFVGEIDFVSVKEVTGYASPFMDSSGNNLMSGYKLVATDNNGYMCLATAVTVTAATTYTNSIWIKRVTGTGQAYIIDTNTTDRAITLTTEWQRFTYAAAAGTTSGQIGVKLAVSGDEVLIAHAQLEAGATASSPIGGAETATQTRNADVIASAVDRSNIKTLVINNDAYVVETALPNNGYTLPQLDINKLAMFTNTLTDEQITANGWTKKVLAFAVSVNIAAGTTVSIEVDGVGTIEWGDGTSDSYSSQVTKTHIYTGGYKGLILFTGTLTRFSTSSNANWYFNVKDAPANLTFLLIAGSNTLTGNIADAPANLTVLLIAGSNTITGNIADAPANLTDLGIIGSNTITGNIADAPANLTTLNITGSNTLTGNIADAPANLTYLQLTGSNTLTGNIANAPANLTTLFITGSNTLADYTAGRVWKTNYNYLYLRQATGAGLSSTEVDNLLIDLAATTWGGSGRTLDIRGVNAARTSASDAAVLSLQAKSVTVLTN